MHGVRGEGKESELEWAGGVWIERGTFLNVLVF